MPQNNLIPTFSIYCEGKKILDTLIINSLLVTLDANEKGSAIINTNIRSSEDFKVQSKELKIGNTIEIKLGYDSNEHSIFKGSINQIAFESQEVDIQYFISCLEVTDVTYKVDQLDQNVLRINLFDKAKYFKVFQEIKDSNKNESINSGEIEILGNAKMKPGMKFHIDQVNDGKVPLIIKTLIHDFRDGEWVSRIVF